MIGIWFPPACTDHSDTHAASAYYFVLWAFAPEQRARNMKLAEHYLVPNLRSVAPASRVAMLKAQAQL